MRRRFIWPAEQRHKLIPRAHCYIPIQLHRPAWGRSHSNAAAAGQSSSSMCAVPLPERSFSRNWIKWRKKFTTVCLSISNWDCIPSGYRRAVVRSSSPSSSRCFGARAFESRISRPPPAHSFACSVGRSFVRWFRIWNCAIIFSTLNKIRLAENESTKRIWSARIRLSPCSAIVHLIASRVFVFQCGRQIQKFNYSSSAEYFWFYGI